MLRERSPVFRTWLVLAVGAMAPGTMALLGHPAHELFTLDSLLEFARVSIFGAFSALFALHVEKPRDPERRERHEDRQRTEGTGSSNPPPREPWDDLNGPR